MKTIIPKSFVLFVLLSVLTLSPSIYAQSQSSFKRTTATILFASIGGGVLGLSTLSFYGKPQEHTDNITTGVLLGFIAGLSFVMYDTYGLQSAAPYTETEKRYLMVRAEDQSKKMHLNPGWQLFAYELSW